MLGDRSRNGPFAEMPGSYEQAIRVRTPIINPGDSLKIEQFFTGYGEIKWAKMTFYPSDDIFETDVTWILSGSDSRNLDKVTFGGQTHKFKETGVTLGFTGVFNPKWSESTSFIDAGESGSVPQVITEKKLGEAPEFLPWFALQSTL